MAEYRKSQILFKTDTKENWESIEDTFSTLKGELYFYKDGFDSKQTNHMGNKIYRPSLKIGDGSSKLSNLSFLTHNYITNLEIEGLFANVLGQSTLGNLVLG